MAKPVNVTISHDLGRVAARGRIDGGIDKLMNSFAAGMLTLDKHWNGDRMEFDAKAMGQHVTGHVDVHDDKVDIEVRLPLLLAGMAQKIAGKIQDDGKLLLEKK